MGSADTGLLQVDEQLANDVKQVVAVFLELSDAALETTRRRHRLSSGYDELVHGDPEGRSEPLGESRAKSGVIVDDPADALPTNA